LQLYLIPALKVQTNGQATQMAQAISEDHKAKITQDQKYAQI